MELLVVIAIIGLLASMLLPAVQRAREAARRSTCQNNMKQIALASHNYLSAHRTFPSGWLEDPNIQWPDTYFAGSIPCPNHPWTSCFPEPQSIPISTLNGPSQLSISDWTMSAKYHWHITLLSYIDELTKEVNVNHIKNEIHNWPMFQTVIPTYLCPSASLPSRRMHDMGYATYRGNMGWWPQNDPPQLNGIFFMNSRVDDRDITDGMSQTFLFGESQSGYWADGYSCCARARDDQPNFDAYWTSTQPNYSVVCVPPNGPATIHYFGFGSFHSGVVTFSMSDGSVRSVAKNIDTNLFRSLCTRSGREAISQGF